MESVCVYTWNSQVCGGKIAKCKNLLLGGKELPLSENSTEKKGSPRMESSLYSECQVGMDLSVPGPVCHVQRV